MALAEAVNKLETTSFSENNLAHPLETTSKCDSIHAVYSQLGKQGEPFRQFVSAMFCYCVLDVLIFMKSYCSGVVVEENHISRTPCPKIRFKVSQITFV
jgi:hypothetical protein